MSSASPLTPRQRRGIDRLGDTMLPATTRDRSFSELRCADRAEAAMRELPAADRADLLMLLGVLAILPTFLVRAFVWLTGHVGWMPGPLGALLRLANLGLKGTVMTLYYSDERVLEQLGYDVGVYVDDLGAGAPS